MMLEYILLIVFVSSFIIKNYKTSCQNFMMFASDDSDIKIAPNSFENFNKPKECETEDAELYLKHKQKGNIEKAHFLGNKFFEIVNEQNDYHDFPNKTFVNSQLKALCGFIAKQKLEKCCPDSIIANSAISVLYENIKRELPDIYSVMNNSATYSVFLLGTFGTINKDVSFGKAFAEICSKQNDRDYIDFGIYFYNKYNLLFSNVCENAIFE